MEALFHPAIFRRSLRLIALGLEPGLGPRFRGDRAGGGLSGADLTWLRANWRTTAMLWSPLPLRRPDWSSPNTTSRTQCRLFSMRQCPRTPCAARVAVSGADEMSERVSNRQESFSSLRDAPPPPP